MSVQLYMKLTGAAMVVVGASGCGFWKAAQYRRRVLDLEQLRQMMFLLKAQILYANAPLSEAFETVGGRTKGALSRFFLAVAKRIDSRQGEPFCDIWREETGNLGEEETALTKSDRQSLEALGDHLGFLDRDTQERTLLMYLEQLEEQLVQLRGHMQERCRICVSLGIMGGLFLMILLV